MVSMGQGGDIVYQRSSDISFLDMVVDSGLFAIAFYLATFLVVIGTIIYIIDERRAKASSNKIVSWCNNNLDGGTGIYLSLATILLSIVALASTFSFISHNMVEDNTMQKYSFGKVEVKEISTGDAKIADAVIYDYERKNSFEVKIWIDSVTGEPTISPLGVVTDEYLNGKMK